MYLDRLILKNFRNFDELDIYFHKKINVILGDNAQGKTNLIEGIYILSMGKSFRTLKDSEMIKFDEENFRLKGYIENKEGQYPVEISANRKIKKIKIDGIDKKKNIDLLENTHIVVFSPEDLKIVKEDPDKRRKFIDKEICQIEPTYYKNISRYKKVLRNRNITLRNDVINEDLLDIWDGYMIDIGSDIMKMRQKFIKELAVTSKEVHTQISSGKENLEVTYEPSIEASQYQDRMIKESLIANRKKDMDQRLTSAGPHRDDIKICIDGVDIRKFGSQGQNRTAALSLKLAELKLIKKERGEDPILLLDDVLSELDITRQEYLLSSFKENQLFITGADINNDLLDKLGDSKRIYLENGKIKNSIYITE